MDINLFVELISHQIRINAIGPEPVDTSLHSAAKLVLSTGQLKQMNQGIINIIPLGCVRSPEEIAKMISFFIAVYICDGSRTDRGWHMSMG